MRKNKSQYLSLRSVLLIIAVSLVWTAAGCSKTVTTYVWQTPPQDSTDDPAQIYPELDPNSPYKEQTAYIREVKETKDKKGKKGEKEKIDLGIVFSGGGTRSAMATIGQLRALHELGWLQKARYVSAVSGGAWGAMPFLFACDAKSSSLYEDVYQNCKKLYKENPDTCLRMDPRIKEDTKRLNRKLLGDYTPPQKLNEDVLCAIPTETNTLMYNMTHAHIGLHMPWSWVTLHADESYANALQSLFLERAGVRQDFFTLSRSVRDKIIERNTILQGMESEFSILRPGMPFPIINAVLFTKRTGSLGEGKPAPRVFPLEITPLYVGFGKSFPHMGYPRTACLKDYTDIGGGWIEPFAYDSRPPDETQIPKKQVDKSKQACVRQEDKKYQKLQDCRESSDKEPGQCRVKLLMPRNHFTLADAIAASGAAPQEIITSIPVAKHGFLENLGFPEFNHWPVRGRVFRGQKMKTPVGDGVDFDECSQALAGRGKKKKTDVVALAHDDSSFEKKPEYAHGDGGHYEYFGLLPLLSRGVQNIIVFVNTKVRFSPYSEMTSEMALKRDAIRKAALSNESDQWSPAWDVPEYAEEYESTKAAAKKINNANIEQDIIGLFRVTSESGLNIAALIGENEEQLVTLHDEFLADRINGNPMIHCAKYKINHDAFKDGKLRTSIPKNYSPNICWVYLDAPDKWFEQIKNSNLLPETMVELYYGTGEFEHFPHYWTFVQGAGEMPGTIINLSQKQANALAELTSWTVCEGANEMARSFNLPELSDKSCSAAK